MSSETTNKGKISASAWLRKVNQYRNYLEEYKKRVKEVREASKAIQEKNAALIKENATLRQAAAAQEEAFIAVKQELVGVKTNASEFVRQFENYKDEVERRIAQYESGKKASTHNSATGSPANINTDLIAQRVWSVLSKHFEQDLFGVFTSELKAVIDSRNSLGRPEPSPRILSPQQRSLRDSFSDVPDSIKRFVKAAGHPRLASTPLRSGPVANAIVHTELPGIEMPPDPAAIVLFRAPEPIIRPPRRNQNPPVIPVISEENEDEPEFVPVSDMEEDEDQDARAPLPPLKPKPSRSAPVKGTKVKNPVVTKPKARSRSRTPSSTSSTLAASTSNNESVRIQTKLFNGRLEARVGNAILQQADEEKKARSLKRKPSSTEVVAKKTEPSVFDFSLHEYIPTKDEEPAGANSDPVNDAVDPVVDGVAFGTRQRQQNEEPIKRNQKARTKPSPQQEEAIQNPEPKPVEEYVPVVALVPLKSSVVDGAGKKARTQKRKQADQKPEEAQDVEIPDEAVPVADAPIFEPVEKQARTVNEEHDQLEKPVEIAEKPVPEKQNARTQKKHQKPVEVSEEVAEIVLPPVPVENNVTEAPEKPVRTHKRKQNPDLERELAPAPVQIAEDPSLQPDLGSLQVVSETFVPQKRKQYQEPDEQRDNSEFVAPQPQKASRSNKRNPADVPKRVKKGRIEPADEENEASEEQTRPSSPASTRSTSSRPQSQISDSDLAQRKPRNGGSTGFSDDFDTRSRPRRNNAIQSYAELPLNVKMRRRWDDQNQQFVAIHKKK